MAILMNFVDKDGTTKLSVHTCPPLLDSAPQLGKCPPKSQTRIPTVRKKSNFKSGTPCDK